MTETNEELLRITKETAIFIYGAGHGGLICYNSLVENGYSVKGFIDRRADEIGTFQNHPVWTIKTVPSQIVKDSLVVVSVANFLSHEAIVCELQANGFRFFLFVAVNEKIRYRDIINKNINKILGKLVIGNEINKLAVGVNQYVIDDVPMLERLLLLDRSDKAVVKNSEGYVTAYISLEQLFEQSIDNQLSDKDSISSILTSTTRIGLFKYFSGEGEEEAVEEYLKQGANVFIQCSDSVGKRISKDNLITESWKTNVLEGRRNVYNKLCDLADRDAGFVENNSPDAVVKNDHLLIMDGRHRAALFIVKKRRYFPVRITENDYYHIINKNAAEKLFDYMEEKNHMKLDVPLNHPCFYDFDVRIPDFYTAFYYGAILEIARFYMGKLNTNDISVCDGLFHEGAVARCMAQMGCKAITVSNDYLFEELSRKIDNVFRVEVEYSNEIQSADIVFATEDALNHVGDNLDYSLLFVESRNKIPSIIKGKKGRDICTISDEKGKLYYRLYTA